MNVQTAPLHCCCATKQSGEIGKDVKLGNSLVLNRSFSNALSSSVIDYEKREMTSSITLSITPKVAKDEGVWRNIVMRRSRF